MKAEEILLKYNITRQTLCAWRRDNKIKYERLPNGRYDYFELVEEHKSETESEKDCCVNSDVEKRLAELENKINLITTSLDYIQQFMAFMNNINFMSGDCAAQLKSNLDALKFERNDTINFH